MQHVTAKVTLTDSKRLRQHLRQRGHDVSLRQAWLLVRAGQEAGRRTDDELRRQERVERVRRGMVAQHVEEMRSLGLWDGD